MTHFSCIQRNEGALAEDSDGQRGVTDVAPVGMSSDFKRWKPDTHHKTSAFIWHKSDISLYRQLTQHYNNLAEDFALDTGKLILQTNTSR